MREFLIEEELATKECLGLKAEEYAEGDDANKLLEGRGLTESQFEAVLHVLDLRIRRAESNFFPLSAAGNSVCNVYGLHCMLAVPGLFLCFSNAPKNVEI